MSELQRRVVLTTSLGKKYIGNIDLPSETFRTTDLFNSSHVFWKNPNMKCYDDTILLHNARLMIDHKTSYKQFDHIQLKLSEIIFFYDDVQEISDESEKKRAHGLKIKVDEKSQTVNIISTPIGTSFYEITGIFFGLFKKKSRDAFVPLTKTEIVEIYKKNDKWTKRKLKLPHDFICISNSHVESITFGPITE